MEFICLQENFKKSLNITQNIIGKNLTLPILNNIFLTIDKKRLKISSTDLELAIINWIPCKVKKEGGITVPAKLLSNFVANLPNKKIEIKVKDNAIYLKCENYRSVIKGLDAKDFPIIPQIENKPILKIDAQKLKTGLGQVINFTSLSEVRPEISGVFINFGSKKDKNIKLVTTDSFRLGEKILVTEKQNSLEGKISSVIIPYKTIQELIRILDEKEGDVEVIIGNNQILFDLPDTKLISRLIEGNYPNYEPLIPKKVETKLTLNREEFLNTIRISSLFSSKINDIKLRVIPKKELIEVSAKDVELGENLSLLSGEIEGKEMEIIFNYKYLLDGLNNILSDKVFLGLNGEANPGVLRPVGDSGFVYVIMPIKL